MRRKLPAEIGDEIRMFVREMDTLAHASRVYSIIQPVVTNAIDHLLLRAKWSDQLHVDRKEKVDA